MVIKKTSFSIIIGILLYILTLSVYAVDYNYDFSTDVFYDIKQDENSNASYIYKVDFKNKLHTKIVSFKNNAAWLNLSPNKKFISYFVNGRQNIFRLDDMKLIYSLVIKSQRTVVWSNDSKYISFFDVDKRELVEIDLSGLKNKKISCDCDVWKTKWYKDRFYYALSFPRESQYGDSKKSSVYKIVNDKLLKSAEIKTLTASPDGKYYYQTSYGVDDSYIYLYDFNGNKIAQFVSPGYVLLDNELKTIWSNDKLRITGLKGTFDLKNGSVQKTQSYWPAGRVPTQLHYDKDLAVDSGRRYILMWNKVKTLYEVEDINAGKIIKTYKKFW